MKKLIALFVLLFSMIGFAVANEPPIIEHDFPIATTQLVEGETYTFNVLASDPEGDDLTDIEIRIHQGELISFDGQIVVWKFTTVDQHGNSQLLTFSVSERGKPDPNRSSLIFGTVQLFLVECDINIYSETFKDQLDHYKVKPEAYRVKVDGMVGATTQQTIDRNVVWLDVSLHSRGWGPRNLSEHEVKDLTSFTFVLKKLSNHSIGIDPLPRNPHRSECK